jgi:hypothetical protein
VIVKEADVESVVERSKDAEGKWEMMARSARRIFDQHFSGNGLADYLGNSLIRLKPSTLILNKTMMFLRLERNAKSLRRKVQNKLSGK